ncbi:hypothetical protein PspLS_09758 [Pyricularia sp. CBS 133598]|nr:hypothetical protein PspLS_09758 [Pyricularia sp. CBS 133598]
MENLVAAINSTSPFETGTTFTKTIHKSPYAAILPSRPELSQTDRTVLITGGSAGIGFATAESFAQAGAKHVIILGRRQDVVEKSVAKLEKEYKDKSVRFSGFSTDVNDLEANEKLWKGFEEDGIVIDVLVLNAAKMFPPVPILELGRDQVWEGFTMNARSLLDLSERFYKQRGNKGKQKFLVNVSSEGIHNFQKSGPYPGYSASKSAGTLLIQLIAKDTSPEEMQVLSFHPGLVWTEPFEKGGVPKDLFDFDDVTLGGNFTVWAASEEARFLHGRFVWAKWDVEELKMGEIGHKIRTNDHYLKVGVVGLHQ